MINLLISFVAIWLVMMVFLLIGIHVGRDESPSKETIRRMAKLAFYSGWRHGKHYGDASDKEYCFKKFVKGYNKKMKGNVIND